MGLFLKDFCNIVLMRDDGRERIVHACMMPGMDLLGSAIMDNTADVGLISPNTTFMVVMGCMFGKFVPILEAAERQWLKAGAVAHCGMVKSRVGLISLGLIPKPDLTHHLRVRLRDQPEGERDPGADLRNTGLLRRRHARTGSCGSTRTRRGPRSSRPRACGRPAGASSRRRASA